MSDRRERSESSSSLSDGPPSSLLLTPRPSLHRPSVSSQLSELPSSQLLESPIQPSTANAPHTAHLNPAPSAPHVRRTPKSSTQPLTSVPHGRRNIPTPVLVEGSSTTSRSTSVGKRPRENTLSLEQPSTKRRYKPVTDEQKAECFREAAAYLKNKHITLGEMVTYMVGKGKGSGGWRRTFKRIFIHENHSWIDSLVLARLKKKEWLPIITSLRQELRTLTKHTNKTTVGTCEEESEDESEQSHQSMSENEQADDDCVDGIEAFPMEAAEARRVRFLQAGDVQMIDKISQFDHIQRYAPSWVSILSAALPLPRHRRVKKGEEQRVRRWIGPLLANLCSKLQPKKGGRFGRLIGMYLWQAGLTRAGITTLHRLGILPSYHTINRSLKTVQSIHTSTIKSFGKVLNRVCGHDNFQCTEKVRQSALGHENRHYDFTTAYIKESEFIPPSGLRQEQHNPFYQLRVQDITPISRSERAQQLKVSNQLWKYCIYNALGKSIPDYKLPRFNQLENGDLWGRDGYGPFAGNDQDFSTGLPNLNGRIINRPYTLSDQRRSLRIGISSSQNVQPSRNPHNSERKVQKRNLRTYTYVLQALPFNEASESGNTQIMEDIFLRQLAVNVSDPQWKDNLFLHFGDALTLQRLHMMKSNHSICDRPFSGYKWLLPCLGLWHLKYNYIDAIVEHHFGGPRDDSSSLYWSFGTAFRSRTVKKNSFEAMHSLVMMAFNSKLVALAVQQTDTEGFSRPGKPINRYSFREWLRKGNKQALPSLINQVVQRITDTLQSTQPDDQVDREFRNNIVFLSNVLPYILLTEAIRYGDIELLRHAIRSTVIVFAAIRRRTIYQYELCRYFWMISTQACNRDLQDIILRESLVNRQGRPDSFYPNDEYNELINAELRRTWDARQTSSQTPLDLLNRFTQTTDFLWGIRSQLEKSFLATENSDHAQMNTMETIWVLVDALLREHQDQPAGMVERPGRGSISYIDHFFTKGQDRLHEVVRSFNETTKRLQSGTVEALSSIFVDNQDASVDPYVGIVFEEPFSIPDQALDDETDLAAFQDWPEPSQFYAQESPGEPSTQLQNEQYDSSQFDVGDDYSQDIGIQTLWDPVIEVDEIHQSDEAHYLTEYQDDASSMESDLSENDPNILSYQDSSLLHDILGFQVSSEDEDDDEEDNNDDNNDDEQDEIQDEISDIGKYLDNSRRRASPG